MNIISIVISVGVVVLAIALLTYATGKTITSLPAFDGGTPAVSGVEQTFNETMVQINSNSGTAFNILSVSPLVLGAAAIIAILIGVFSYMSFGGEQ